MAHYAFLDENNIVTEVISGRHEYEIVDGISDWEAWYGEFRNQACKRTSYNASINGFRKNFAGIGYRYDEDLDAFIAPQPYESWIFNSETCQWEAPIKRPTDENGYVWNKESGSWQIVVRQEIIEIEDIFGRKR
jgi:hypothetical protein